jgi:hypothetical protein
VLLRRTAAIGVALLGACGGADGGASYDVVAQQATVGTRDANNACWDPSCAAPWSYVCAVVNGLRKCSAPIKSATPQYLETLFTSVPASSLKTGMRVDLLLGSGPTSAPADRRLCPSNVGNIVATDAILATGRFDLVCTPTVVVTIGLPQAP